MKDQPKLQTHKKLTSQLLDNSAELTSHVISRLHSNINISENESGINTQAVAEIITHQQKLMRLGHLQGIEEMLLSQIHVLNAIANQMTLRMATTEHMKKLETYGNLALKAQNQLRQTAATLAEFKAKAKPSVVHEHESCTHVTNPADASPPNQKVSTHALV